MPTPRKYESGADRQRAYRARQAGARHAELQAKGLPATASISSMPGNARWEAMRQRASALIDLMLNEMRAYADERSEAWQESDKGELFEERICLVEGAQEALDEIP